MNCCVKTITVDYMCIANGNYKKCKFYKPNAELGASCFHARYSITKHKILCMNPKCTGEVKQKYYTGSTDGYIPYTI